MGRRDCIVTVREKSSMTRTSNTFHVFGRKSRKARLEIRDSACATCRLAVAHG